MSFVSFLLLNLMPGDPLDSFIRINPDLKSEDIQKLRESLSLDKPITTRYLIWIKSLLAGGDLGYSRSYSRPVLDILKPRIANSFILMTTSIVLSLILSLTSVFLYAVKRKKIINGFIDLITTFGISAPTFWVGILLILIFSVNFKLLPAGGIGEGEYFSIFRDFKFLILPSLALIFFIQAYWTKYLIGSYSDISSKDFMKTARSKGLSEERIFFTHGLKNLLIPIITLLVLYIPGIFGGALVTESIFSWPGVGRLLYESILGNDYNVAMVILLIITFVTVLTTFLIDSFYRMVDPRLKAK